MEEGPTCKMREHSASEGSLKRPGPLLTLTHNPSPEHTAGTLPKFSNSSRPREEQFPSAGECPPPGTPFSGSLSKEPGLEKTKEKQRKSIGDPPTPKSHPPTVLHRLPPASGGTHQRTAGPYSLGTLYQGSHLLFTVYYEAGCFDPHLRDGSTHIQEG